MEIETEIKSISYGISETHKCILIHMCIYIYWLVVWNIFYFPIYWEESFHLTFIFFRGVGQPPTRYIHRYCVYIYIHTSRNWLCLMDAGWEVGVSIRRLIDFGHLHGGRRQAALSSQNGYKYGSKLPCEPHECIYRERESIRVCIYIYINIVYIYIYTRVYTHFEWQNHSMGWTHCHG